jgi:hypothetical protein
LRGKREKEKEIADLRNIFSLTLNGENGRIYERQPEVSFNSYFVNERYLEKDLLFSSQPSTFWDDSFDEYGLDPREGI